MLKFSNQNQFAPPMALSSSRLPLFGLTGVSCTFSRVLALSPWVMSLVAIAISSPAFSQSDFSTPGAVTLTAASGSTDPIYSFDSEEYRSLQFQYSTELPRASATEHHTQFRFKLSPGKFDFSLAGGFGLGGVFSNPEIAFSSSTRDRFSIDRNLPQLHDGLSYSAGIDIEHEIEHEIEHLSDNAYVSSGQLGLNYGRMGRVWYNGVDLSFHQSASLSDTSIRNEVMSFDLTAGRRLGITGISQEDPLWLLSLRGDFDINNTDGVFVDESSANGHWYLNPTLFWDRPGFRFAAQLELPIDEGTLRDFEPPDYKLRAVIEKSFK